MCIDGEIQHDIGITECIDGEILIDTEMNVWMHRLKIQFKIERKSQVCRWRELG